MGSRWIAALGLCLVASCGGPSAGVPPQPTPGAGTNTHRPSSTATAVGGWHGTVTKVSKPRPSFTLVDASGRSFDFAARTRGRATLLFFGYTNCPELCPTTMADIAAAKRMAGVAGDAVTVVFVTTDPARDSGDVLRRWLDQFDASFIGLTGTPAQIDAAQKAAGVPAARVPQAPGGRYDVAHAAQVAAYGVDGTERVRYFAGATVSDYAADLPRLVAAS